VQTQVVVTNIFSFIQLGFECYCDYIAEVSYKGNCSGY